MRPILALDTECQACGRIVKIGAKGVAAPHKNDAGQFCRLAPTQRACTECGAAFFVQYPSIRKTTCSRACQARLMVRNRPPMAGADNPNYRGGKVAHPLYERYLDMIGRCYRPSHLRYSSYGGRGITVCQRWRDDFWAYASDLGNPPDDTQRWTVDRIDNDGPYAPENCRWATYTTQSRNRRDPELWRGVTPRGHTSKLTPDDQRAIFAARQDGTEARDLADKYGVSITTIYNVLRGKHLHPGVEVPA